MVTLVGGASGVVKSSVAIPLATRYGVPLAEADDIVTALKALTTERELLLLHYWDTHPEASSWAPEKIAELHLAVADSLRPGLAAVIADHIELGAPLVIEGGYLPPELVTGLGDQVRAVVIAEPDADRIVANLSAREPSDGTQSHRALVSVGVDAELTERANRIGVPVVPAWPWPDGLERVDAALARRRSAGRLLVTRVDERTERRRQ